MPANHPTLSLFRTFLAIPSPPGREERFAEEVRRQVAARGWESETDAAGNVTVTVQGRRPGLPAVVLAAHMDEIGMVVTRVDPDGTLRVTRSGGLYPWKLGEGPVEVLGDRAAVPGLFSMGSIHTPRARDRRPDWEECRILTGLEAAELREAGVRAGSSAVPAADRRGPVLLGRGPDPLVAAWTFDDRIDVVNLLLLLGELREKGVTPARTLVFAFTVHEEAGCHGAKFVAQRVQPELFVAVDGCPVLPELDLSLDGRPGIWSRDGVAHYDQAVVAFFLRAAGEVGVDLVPAVYEGAASDASSVYATGGAPRAATLGHIRDNSHGYEVARLSSIENVRKVLLRFAETWE